MNTKTQKLFGTDGVRGKANEFPIVPETIVKIGKALGTILQRESKNPQRRKMVLIGKDTRLSGYMLEQALASGLNSMGIWVQLTGPLPTPGIGFLAQNMRADAGVIISASHNPYYDNGIKIFNADGIKISREVEEEIENLVAQNSFATVDHNVGRTRRIDDAAGRYIVYAKNVFPGHLNLESLNIALDCANGAGYKVAPAIFGELGAELSVIGNNPNGYNINKDCGSLHIEALQKVVLEKKADVGISLDGDADRVVMVDDQGQVVNGDHILGIAALHIKKQRPLSKVVSTQMANSGLEHLLNRNGMELIRVDVGDKNVMNKMSQDGIILGGEPSGHIIFSEYSLTGDACIAALNVLAVMISENKKLSELRKEIKDVPQIVKHVPIKKRQSLVSIPGYTHFIEQMNSQLNNKGRIYIRFSGTEPIVRVMVEGENQPDIERCSSDISSFLTSHLN